MKLCLIMPLDTYDKELAQLLIGEIMEPMGHAYIAGVVERGGHEVRIIDRRILFIKMNYDIDKLNTMTLDIIKDFGADYVGLYVNVALMRDANNLVNLIKSSSPKIKCLIGGPHATLMKSKIFSDIQNLDIVSFGEGEYTLLDILDGKPIEEIKGIAYRSRDEIVVNESRGVIKELDSLALPARHLLDINFYFNPDKNILVDYSKSYHGNDARMAEILTSRGCPMVCRFCASPLIWNKCVRYHSTDWVLNDLEDIIRFGANYAYFNDDVFTVNHKRAIEICDGIIKKGINKKLQWVAQSRPENIDEELLHKMMEAGCVRIEFGFETGSQDTLDRMNKKTKIEHYYRTVEMVKKEKISFQANIIYGFYKDTKEDVEKTIKFIEDIEPDSVLLNAFQAVPGTEIYKTLKEENYFIDDSFIPSHPVLNPYNYTSMEEDEFKEYFWKIFKISKDAYEYYMKNKELFDLVGKRYHSKFI